MSSAARTLIYFPWNTCCGNAVTLVFGDASVLEVVELQAGSTYRAVYTVRFRDAVYVLHVFQKKSKSGAETPKPDKDLIEDRLKKVTEMAKKAQET